MSLPETVQHIDFTHNLPIQSTSIVGRDEELAELRNLLSDPQVRLVTILGPGGIGKTRLALEVAVAQLPNFSQGVYFVDLVPVQSAVSIVSSIAQALNFSLDDNREPKQQLFDYVREKQILLVLDNFEHLLDGASLIGNLLQVASKLKILVTSRTKLSLQSEQLFLLKGLDYSEEKRIISKDATHSNAVELFLQSAHRAQPDFAPTKDDLSAIAQICHLVQGIPLGIILAATWVELLTPVEIATEIRQNLDFLETDLRDLPERQQSLRAVFNYSWQLLSQREREIFQALSVFRGSFTRQAAQEVTGASLKDLMAFSHKSLLNQVSVGHYELHQLLRQYTGEKLTQDSTNNEAVLDRHSKFYANAIQQWSTDWKSPRSLQAQAGIRINRANILAAWEWAVVHQKVEYIDQLADRLSDVIEGGWEHQQKSEIAYRQAAEKLATIEFSDAKRVLAKILNIISIR